MRNFPQLPQGDLQCLCSPSFLRWKTLAMSVNLQIKHTEEFCKIQVFNLRKIKDQNMSCIWKSGAGHRLTCFRSLLFLLHAFEWTWRGNGWGGKSNYFYLTLQSKEEFLIKYNKAFPMGTSVAVKKGTWQTCCINVFQELVWMNWYCWGISQEKKNG